jgi:hypothetical protein
VGTLIGATHARTRIAGSSPESAPAGEAIKSDPANQTLIAYQVKVHMKKSYDWMSLT